MEDITQHEENSEMRQGKKGGISLRRTVQVSLGALSIRFYATTYKA